MPEIDVASVPDANASIDAKRFRQVLGQYPTGVCVITAMQESGPIGMVVGSFTSVSLDPPLVAFFPDRNSSTWAMLSRSPRFCVNILSADQEDICRKLGSKDPDKYAGLAFASSPGGAPILDEAVAWIDCDVHSVTEAGDHFIVLGRVTALEASGGGLPLLFFQGGYGRFATSSLVASDTHGLVTEQLRIIDLARGEMERLAADADGQCVAAIRLGEELIVAASAGRANGPIADVSVGRRLPFAPPLGAAFAAWLPPAEAAQWIGARPDAGDGAAYRAALATVRDRGFAVATLKSQRLDAWTERLTRQPDAAAGQSDALKAVVRDLDFDVAEMAAGLDAGVGMISAPIFDAAGRVVLSLTVQGFPPLPDEAAAESHVARLLAGAERITERLGGRRP